MARSRQSARRAGSRFESAVAGYLRRALGDGRIERRAKTGAKDRGDITGLLMRGRRVVVECKDCARLELPRWLEEAEVERGNDDAAFGLVVHKRKGVADPAEQYVTMTLGTLAAMLAGGPELVMDEGAEDSARAFKEMTGDPMGALADVMGAKEEANE